MSDEIEQQAEPSEQVNEPPGEVVGPGQIADSETGRAMARRRWLVGIKSPDLRERAVAALTRVGRAGLREIKRVEASGKAIPPTLLSSASRPWEALLAHGEKLDEMRFARSELEAAKKMLAQVRAMKRRA